MFQGDRGIDSFSIIFLCFFGFIIDKTLRLRYNDFNISFAQVRKKKERKDKYEKNHSRRDQK